VTARAHFGAKEREEDVVVRAGGWDGGWDVVPGPAEASGQGVRHPVLGIGPKRLSQRLRR
jgi:hypothetical protein